MKRAPLFPLLIVLAVLTSAPAGAQTTEPLLQRAELRALNNEISGELAQDYIRDIARFHRLQPSRGYTAAATVFLTDDGPDRSRRLAGEAAARADARLAGELKRGFDAIGAAETGEVQSTYKEAVNWIMRAVDREVAALNTIISYSARDRNVDGKNSLLDIRNAVSAEFEPLPLPWVEDYLRLLARAGVVMLEK